MRSTTDVNVRVRVPRTATATFTYATVRPCESASFVCLLTLGLPASVHAAEPRAPSFYTRD